MSRCVITILISGLLFSCANNKLIGLYGKCSKHYYACSQYLLKKNNEFEYSNLRDVGGDTVIKGAWKQYHDTVVLNSYVQPSDRVVEVIESTIDTSSHLTFEFYNESIKGKDAAFIRLNSDTAKAYLLTSYDFLNLPENKLTKLFISPFFDAQAFPVPYIVKNPGSNHFLVRTKNLDQSVFITDERFLVRNKGIYRIDSNKKTGKNIFYKKVKSSK